MSVGYWNTYGVAQVYVDRIFIDIGKCLGTHWLLNLHFSQVCCNVNSLAQIDHIQPTFLYLEGNAIFCTHFHIFYKGHSLNGASVWHLTEIRLNLTKSHKISMFLVLDRRKNDLITLFAASPRRVAQCNIFSFDLFSLLHTFPSIIMIFRMWESLDPSFSTASRSHSGGDAGCERWWRKCTFYEASAVL